MEGWTAVVIGVSKAGSLPELPGAVNGANKFAGWAKQQGYEVHLVTDEPGNGPVRSDRLKTLMGTIVDDRATTRLLIFFSGHGAQAGSAPFWLLSGWETDADEAVNAGISMLNGDRSGIGQIAIFVDACRVPVQGVQLLNGFTLFPRRPALPRAPHWDLFYGARVDAISQEIPGDDPVDAYGLFSDVLMDGLSGRAADAIDTRTGLVPARAVTSSSLSVYLQRELPLRSSARARVQYPDPRAGWLPPHNVYFDADLLPLAPALKNVRGSAFERLSVEADLQVSGFEARIAAASGRDSFETRIGLSLIGARPLRVVVGAGDPAADLFQEDGAWHVRGYRDGEQAVLVALEGGTWFAATLFAGFVGATLFEAGRATSLVYAPALHGPREQEAPTSVVDRATYWSALARAGHRVPAADRESALAGLGAYGHVNPTIAILLAYACVDAGRLRDVPRIEDAMRAAGQPIPFDVSLLAQAADGRARFTGRFPSMSRGWALLDAAERLPSAEALARARPGVVSSLWTTLSPSGGAWLSRLLETGAL